MTLLEDLEAAAREIDCPISDLCTAEDNCTRRPLAARLRAHAARLWSEMELHGHNVGVSALLERINGGPITPGEPPAVPMVFSVRADPAIRTYQFSYDGKTARLYADGVERPDLLITGKVGT